MKAIDVVKPLITILVFCACGMAEAQSFGDQILIRPESPSTFDSIRVDVPVKACLLGDPVTFTTTTSTQVTGRVISLMVDQYDPSHCEAEGDRVTTKAFTFVIQPLSQGSYTVNFTRTLGPVVDLQRSSTVVVSAPFGAKAATLTHVTVLLLPLLLLVAVGLVIAAPRFTHSAGASSAELPLQSRSWPRAR